MDGLEVVSARTGVPVVWLDKPLCAADGICRTSLDDGASIYVDDGHLTSRGSVWLLRQTDLGRLVAAQ
jgi:hypothetical protein